MGGASKTESTGASACSASPPCASCVIATTRRPSQRSPPAPTASATPHTSMPSVKGGFIGIDVVRPWQRSTSLKLSEPAATRTRT
jgi:hypothetical protein